MRFSAWLRLLFHIPDRRPRATLPIYREVKQLEDGDAAWVKEISELAEWWHQLLQADQYVPGSAYRHRMKSMKAVLHRLEGREDWIQEHVSPQVIQALGDFRKPQACVDAHNHKYVEKALITQKDMLDHLLDPVDPELMLDEDQRRVVLCDEDYTLVVAGAGAGKTMTVAAKIRYLVTCRHVDPSRILVITFTRRAVEELRDRIQKSMGISCPIATFHSTGNAILHHVDTLPFRVADDRMLWATIRNYLGTVVMKEPKLVRPLLLFFATYLDQVPTDQGLDTFLRHHAQADYYTLRSLTQDCEHQLMDRQKHTMVTIQQEEVRSAQEAEIANFLYLQGLDYVYEPVYPYRMPGSEKPYTPDFLVIQGDRRVYLEHFGISQGGENSLYTADELDRYRKAIRDKIQLHHQHGTELIYTFSSYQDHRGLEDHLREVLLHAGFVFNPRDPGTVVDRILKEDQNYKVEKLVNLLGRFLQNFKTCGFGEKDFDRMRRSTDNVRTHVFLEIAQACYLEYERVLREQGMVDFADMINESARVLKDVEHQRIQLPFEYVIVDEYQDISRQRFDLVQALRNATSARILAVGDDWQSIYAFSGSDITLFTHFREKMGYAAVLRIENTYRNAQEVIDVAGNFIQKNPEQIQKTLHSPKSIHDPILIFPYSTRGRRNGEDRRSGENYALSAAVERILETIRTYAQEEGVNWGEILLLGRYGYDGERLERSGLFEYERRGGRVRSVKYPDMSLTFMTAHSSKGLGYDNVIILNGKNAVYGFPCKVEQDPVLNLVEHQDRSMDYAEERRLFYVALTRTRNRVYLTTPEDAPSEFLLEIASQDPRVRVMGDWFPGKKGPTFPGRACPVCGFPLQLRYREGLGLRLYMCTNEQEVCGFMTNDLAGGKHSIRKCDACQDGYLIVKRGPNGKPFLGCTEWKPNRKGCNRTVSLETEENEPLPEIPVSVHAVKEEKTEQKPEEPPVHREREIIPFVLLKPVVVDGLELNQALHGILQTVSDLSMESFPDEQELVLTLRGEKEAAKKSREVPLYGFLRDVPEARVRTMIQWLADHQFLKVITRRTPCLHLTFNSQHYDQKMTMGLLQALRNRLEKTK